MKPFIRRNPIFPATDSLLKHNNESFDPSLTISNIVAKTHRYKSSKNKAAENKITECSTPLTYFLPHIHSIQNLVHTLYGAPLKIKETYAPTRWSPWQSTLWINQFDLQQGLTHYLPRLLLEIIRAKISPVHYFNWKSYHTYHAPHLDTASFALVLRSIETRRIIRWVQVHHPHLYAALLQHEYPMREFPHFLPSFHTFCLALHNKQRLYTYKVYAPIAYALHELHQAIIKYENSVASPIKSKVPIIHSFHTDVLPWLCPHIQSLRLSPITQKVLVDFWHAWQKLAPMLLSQAYTLYSRDLSIINGFLQQNPQQNKQMQQAIEQRRCAFLLNKIYRLKPQSKIPQHHTMHMICTTLKHMSEEIEFYDHTMIYARQQAQHMYRPPYFTHMHQQNEIIDPFKASSMERNMQNLSTPIWPIYHHMLDRLFNHSPTHPFVFDESVVGFDSK